MEHPHHTLNIFTLVLKRASPSNSVPVPVTARQQSLPEWPALVHATESQGLG